MRNPVLILPLVAAAVVSVAAQAASPHAPRLSPAVHGGIGSFHVESPRQYPPESLSRPGEETRGVGKEKEQAHREHISALRNHRPEPEHLADDPRFVPAKGAGENGGVSASDPAVGADAGQGGDSASSEDGSPAPGFNLGNVVGQAFSAGASVYRPDVPQEDDSYAFRPQQPASAFSAERVPRNATMLRKRQDVVGDVVGDDDPNSSNENSGQDGADGQSIRGSETDGEGPDGGHAHAGYPGSSHGGHVYNYPSGDQE